MLAWGYAAKVFKKLGLTVPENVVQGVINNKPGVIEVVLSNLRVKIEQVWAMAGEHCISCHAAVFSRLMDLAPTHCILVL